MIVISEKGEETSRARKTGCASHLIITKASQAVFSSLSGVSLRYWNYKIHLIVCLSSLSFLECCSLPLKTAGVCVLRISTC